MRPNTSIAGAQKNIPADHQVPGVKAIENAVRAEYWQLIRANKVAH
jgi:hypothetical protein